MLWLIHSMSTANNQSLFPQPCPRTPHTCWVLTRKRTAWRALVVVEALMWEWEQGELGVLSVVRLDR